MCSYWKIRTVEIKQIGTNIFLKVHTSHTNVDYTHVKVFIKLISRKSVKLAIRAHLRK